MTTPQTVKRAIGDSGSNPVRLLYDVFALFHDLDASTKPTSGFAYIASSTKEVSNDNCVCTSLG